MNLETAYEKMARIRAFEETLLSLFSENKLFGTTHTYLGQEAVAVAAGALGVKSGRSASGMAAGATAVTGALTAGLTEAALRVEGMG